MSTQLVLLHFLQAAFGEQVSALFDRVRQIHLAQLVHLAQALLSEKNGTGVAN
ncbi:hypothetical protein [Photobacterium chitinilyticum]|uniref:hypothetical protein n=1 Tax=Photobacterium chitinilyticum TaxID=2485123 RepID=UPI003D1199E4